ncbi:hypothetical protein FHG87_018370 [Trinorchestia longiramus]|nr:hypothetical protein FHG87_018370 [Trinorchestia longiramus]
MDSSSVCSSLIIWLETFPGVSDLTVAGLADGVVMSKVLNIIYHSMSSLYTIRRTLGYCQVDPLLYTIRRTLGYCQVDHLLYTIRRTLGYCQVDPLLYTVRRTPRVLSSRPSPVHHQTDLRALQPPERRFLTTKNAGF